MNQRKAWQFFCDRTCQCQLWVWLFSLTIVIESNWFPDTKPCLRFWPNWLIKGERCGTLVRVLQNEKTWASWYLQGQNAPPGSSGPGKFLDSGEKLTSASIALTLPCLCGRDIWLSNKSTKCSVQSLNWWPWYLLIWLLKATVHHWFLRDQWTDQKGRKTGRVPTVAILA